MGLLLLQPLHQIYLSRAAAAAEGGGRKTKRGDGRKWLLCSGTRFSLSLSGLREMKPNKMCSMQRFGVLFFVVSKRGESK